METKGSPSTIKKSQGCRSCFTVEYTELKNGQLKSHVGGICIDGSKKCRDLCGIVKQDFPDIASCKVCRNDKTLVLIVSK